MTPSGFIRDEGGALAILAGAAIAAVVGLAAFTVDLSNAYSVNGRLQNAADAAALAAAQRLPERKDKEWQAQAQAFALKLVESNVGRSDGTVSTAADIVFGQYDLGMRRFLPDARPFNAVRVTTRRTAAAGNAVKTYFGGLFGVDHFDLETQAIAMKRLPGTCIYALDESASAALIVAGIASLSAPSCAIQVNSTASDAAVTEGNGTVEASSIRVVGGASGSGFSPTPQTEEPTQRDPLAGLPEPAQPGPCYMTDFNLKTSQVLPSNKTYCGSASFSGNAEIQLEPGIYYFKDAEVKISSASFTGKDVLIFLDANSTIHISGNGTHDLTAAETGPYAGIVLFQSRDAPNPVNKKSGNSRLALSGAIYMPSSTFQVRGTGDVDAKPGKVRSEQGGGQQGQGQGEGEGQGHGQGEGEGGKEGEPGGEEQGEGEKQAKKPAFVTEIEYVVAYRFDLSGNANMRVGRQQDDPGGLYAVLVR